MSRVIPGCGRVRRCLSAALSCAATILCLAWTVHPAGAAQDDVILNFANVDIEALAKVIGQITGRNFIIDPRAKGAINIVSSSPIPRSQVYSVFLSALRLNGFAVVESGGASKIVPEADAKLNAGPVIEGQERASGDRIVTLVHPLQHESAAQLLPILRPLIPPNNTIAVLPGSNSLIITDYADNLTRIRRIIQALDRPETGGEIAVLGLKHASAVDVAQVLAKLLPESGGPLIPGAPPPRLLIAPDVRSNSLLVRTDSPTQLARARYLVASLDVPARAPGAAHVVFLRNADATKLAETLRALASSEARVAVPGGPPGQTTGATPVSFIQADQATNSLIIAAPEAVYNSLRAVIEQLDSRRAQVYLEALIAEVSTDRAAEFGIQFQSLSGANAGGNASRVIGGTNFRTRPGSNIQDASRSVGTLGPGLNVGVIRGRITLPGVGEILNIGVLARALATDADANILSTPNLLMMDNEEAKIVVGQNVPFITGSFAQATSGGAGGTGVNPFQTIERRDVGLTLRVRPQIAEGRTVKLKIYQEVSSVQDTSNAAGIITSKRSIESTVLVDDGEIVVLGGLIQDDVKSAVDKVPVLGDLPVIGQIFRYDTQRRTKTNLMVFLRPVVMRDTAAAATITQDRYDYIRNEQGAVVVPPHLLLPELPSPRLPALAR